MNDESAIVAIGHFNGVKVYRKGQLIIDQKTNDWAHVIAIGECADGLEQEIVVGLVDDSIISFVINLSTLGQSVSV